MKRSRKFCRRIRPIPSVSPATRPVARSSLRDGRNELVGTRAFSTTRTLDSRSPNIRAAIEAKKRWNRYIQLLNEAKTLTVPVINQNRFLALIGYIYQR